MSEERGKAGRPVGRDYGVVRSIRLTDDDVELLKQLAERWGCSEPAAVRRLIREKAAELEMAASNG